VDPEVATADGRHASLLLSEVEASLARCQGRAGDAELEAGAGAASAPPVPRLLSGADPGRWVARLAGSAAAWWQAAGDGGGAGRRHLLARAQPCELTLPCTRELGGLAAQQSRPGMLRLGDSALEWVDAARAERRPSLLGSLRLRPSSAVSALSSSSQASVGSGGSGGGGGGGVGGLNLRIPREAVVNCFQRSEHDSRAATAAAADDKDDDTAMALSRDGDDDEGGDDESALEAEVVIVFSNHEVPEWSALAAAAEGAGGGGGGGQSEVWLRLGAGVARALLDALAPQVERYHELRRHASI
jgi:hypothetical protein